MRHLRWFTTLAVVAAGLVFAASAAAGKGDTLYVGHGSTGDNSSCASPGYNSVQAAVDAAGNGKTVYLCGGQFSEQVFVQKSITLTGDPGSGLTAVGTTFTSSTSRYPAAFANDNLFVPQALLVVDGAKTDAKVNGLTISGPMPGDGSCAEQEFGVLALEGKITLKSDSVLNIADTSPALYGCQFGVGIQVGRHYWPTAGFSTFKVEDFNANSNIDSVTVSGYEKNGITVDGIGSDTDLKNSTVTGGGRGAPFGDITAQNGIQISRGADGDVHNNTVSSNSYTGTAAFASSGGILVFGGCGDPLTTGVDVHNNTLVNNDVGIYLSNSADNCADAPTSATKNHAHDNTISNDMESNHSFFQDYAGNNYTGYQAGIDEQGNGDEVNNNTISGAGYSPSTTPGGPFVLPIDTVSYPTIKAKVHNNTYNGNPTP